MKLNNTEISPSHNVLDLDLSEITDKSIDVMTVRVTDQKTGIKFLGYLQICTNSQGVPRFTINVQRATTHTAKSLLLNRVKD